MAAFAAEAADEAPRALMTAAPRFATVRDEGVLEPGLVGDELVRGFAADLAVRRGRGTGCCCGCPRWSCAATARSARRPSSPARLTARLWSSRVMAVQRSAGIRGVVVGDQAVRVARVADDQDAHVAGGVARQRRALADEDLAVDAEQVLRFMPCLARAGSRRGSRSRRPSKARSASSVTHDVVQEREGAIVQLHRDAFERGQGGRDLEQLQDHRLIRARRSRRTRCRRSRAYPICPAAPVTATRTGVGICGA